MRWLEPTPVDVPAALREFTGGHPLIAERLVRAGLDSVSAAQAFLDPASYAAASPFELPDLDAGVARLKHAIINGQRILIWGDFDVDGQTATALLLDGLHRLGADVRYHVPLRDGEGHGISIPRLEKWLETGIDVIITCDTGITSHEAVEMAQAAGVDVVITDHHMLGDTLPAAFAVINPMRLHRGHALSDLPGVGVAWQVISGLAGEEDADSLFDLVALGIVADVAIQMRDTRYLLQRGIDAMRLTTRPGMKALLERAAINPLEITETDIGFGLGPRLNAQGRLGDAAASVELLTTQDEARAAELANQLEGMNARRRLETSIIEASAESMIDREPSLLDYAAIVLAHPEWSSGIVGIVANHLAERFHKPVVLLCEKNEIAFGSARSVPGCNITNAIRANREMLYKFGGHAMAAGLSLRRDAIFDFRRALSRTVREMMPSAETQPTLQLDGCLRLDEISMSLVEDLRRLAPFGNGNPPLTLVTRNLRLVRRKKLMARGDNFELVVEDDKGRRQRVTWWRADTGRIPDGLFDLAFTLDVRRVKEAKEVSMQLVDIKPSAEEVVITVSTAADLEIEDYSDCSDRHDALSAVLDRESDAIVWREMDGSVSGSGRHELRQAQTLVVWTPPPGPEELLAALATVQPEKVIFFGVGPQDLSVITFLRRLGGLTKYILSTAGGAGGGQTTIEALAAATAQRNDAIRYGLHWFAETGRIGVEIDSKGVVTIFKVSLDSSGAERPQIERLITNILEETAAYRRRGFELIRTR